MPYRWGLYAEDLGLEMGAFDDGGDGDLSLLGYYSGKLLRAARQGLS